MRRLLALGLVSGVLVGGAGCGSPEGEELPRTGLAPLIKVRPPQKKEAGGTVEQEAVLKVVEASRAEFKKQYATLTADAQPSQVVKVFEAYLAEMDKQEVKDCPLEFRAAWGRHLKAWRAFQADLKRVPDDVHEDVAFMEAVQALFGMGPSDKAKVLGADPQTTARKVTATLAAVHSAAEAAGVSCQ